jgi:CubicO group peptidase (beta-lactamase class C family)
VSEKTKSKSLAPALVVLMLSAFLAGCTGGSRIEYPGESWKSLSPEDAGFDPVKLDAFVAHVGGSGCVVRHGRMVKTWGHYDHALDVASAVKTVYAHLVYMLIKRGDIPDLDARVMDFEPRLRNLNSGLGYKDRRITWRHLVTQTACYGVHEAPGEAFDYSDYQSALLIDTLVQHVSCSGYHRVDEKLVNPMLRDLIDCQDAPTLHGVHVPPGRLRISARDFARFGLLYMHEGKWKSKQVVPRDLAGQAFRSPHPETLPRTRQEAAERIPDQRTIGAGENQEAHLNSYSYMWWLNGVMDNGQRVLPGVPTRLVFAVGHAGGDALVLMPELDIVLCWIDGMEGRAAWRFSQRGRNYVAGALQKFMQALSDQQGATPGP